MCQEEIFDNNKITGSQVKVIIAPARFWSLLSETNRRERYIFK